MGFNVYMFVSLTRIAYVIKEAVSFGGLGELMSMVHITWHAWDTDQQEESCTLLAYMETGTIIGDLSEIYS